MTLRDAVEASARLRMAHLPTPLQPMQRLGAHLGGPHLWVKRDDLTGVGLGGNKVRKLEYVLPDALDHGADVLVTAGVAQSNSVRQIAAAAAHLGLDCQVVELTDRVVTAERRTTPTGNALLIRLFGASVRRMRWTGDRATAVQRVAEQLAASGRRPYVVDYGVSNPLGAMGYVGAACEILDQAEISDIPVTTVVHATGSGGTQAGLVAGLHDSGVHVIGIDADAEPDRVRARVSGIALQLANDLGLDARGVDAAIEVVGGHAGPEYGAVTDGVVEAIDLGARLEGLVLDPVYSGKGLAGLIALIRAGRFDADDHVVFIHTGGAPGLLAAPGIAELITEYRATDQSRP